MERGLYLFNQLEMLLGMVLKRHYLIMYYGVVVSCRADLFDSGIYLRPLRHVVPAHTMGMVVQCAHANSSS